MKYEEILTEGPTEDLATARKGERIVTKFSMWLAMNNTEKTIEEIGFREVNLGDKWAWEKHDAAKENENA